MTIMIEAYNPFGSRGEFVLATEDQLCAMSDADRARYQRLADAWDSNAHADRDLLDCEKEVAAVVAAARELGGRLAAFPRLTQWDLVMQARETNR
jgi:hypothetical protein